MRMIDADALIKSIKECVEAKDANCEWKQVQGLECALECIDEEPTVQPVVRCSECEHWDEGICYCDGYEIHCQDYYVGDMHTEPDFFCGFGKRKGADE